MKFFIVTIELGYGFVTFIGKGNKKASAYMLLAWYFYVRSIMLNVMVNIMQLPLVGEQQAYN